MTVVVFLLIEFSCLRLVNEREETASCAFSVPPLRRMRNDVGYCVRSRKGGEGEQGKEEGARKKRGEGGGRGEEGREERARGGKDGG